MNQIYKLSILTTLLFLLVSCGSDAKEANKSDKSKAEVIKNYTDSIRDTPLQGEIIGDVNGKTFTYFDEKERPGKIRETNTGKSLNLTFSTLPTLILTINVRPYNGADTYDTGADTKLLSLKNVKSIFKNKDGNKLTIIEDDDTHVKGSISFATVSDKNEDIVINATFDLTKVVIDPNDQQALLDEIKENPGSVASLGDLKADKDFMLKAIATNQIAFRYADKSLKADREFILKALKGDRKNFLLLMHADKEVKSDKDFAMKAVKVNKMVINLLDGKLKKDKDVIAASKEK